MKLYIANPSGKTLTLNVEASDTVESVKQKIQDKMGLPVDEQRLIYAGKQLEDFRLLSDYAIYGENGLRVVPRPKTQTPPPPPRSPSQSESRSASLASDLVSPLNIRRARWRLDSDEVTLPYEQNDYYKEKRSLPRFNADCANVRDATQYYRNRLIQGLVHTAGQGLEWTGAVEELAAAEGPQHSWGCTTTIKINDRVLHSVFVYPDSRGQGHMTRWLSANPSKELFTNPDCELEKFFATRGVVPYVVPSSRVRYAPVYGLAEAFYGDKVTDRTGIHMMNHIDEGLFVLEAIGASELAKRAYILHPLVQGDEDLKRFWNSTCPGMLSDPLVLSLALEYRNIANAHLSFHPPPSEQPFHKSPLKDVNDMLVADKVQNRKDFELFHKGRHPRSARLASYFAEWLEKLGVSEEQYQALRGQMLAATGGEALARASKRPKEGATKDLKDLPGYQQAFGGGGEGGGGGGGGEGKGAGVLPPGVPRLERGHSS